MTDVTVRQFADVVGLPVDRLMVQLNEAGLKISGADDTISDTDKMQLLSYLRKSHGKSDSLSVSQPKKVTLRRKTTSLQDENTVQSEVRRKRTYVKRAGPVSDAENIENSELARKIVSDLKSLNSSWITSACMIKTALLLLADSLGKSRKGGVIQWLSDDLPGKCELYLLSILRALQCGWVSIYLQDEEVRYAAGAAAAIADRVTSPPDSINVSEDMTVVYNAILSATVDDDPTVGDSLQSISNLIDAIESSAIINELTESVNHFFWSGEVSGLLAQPIGGTLTQRQKNFIDGLRTIGKGFDYWADWYADRFKGEALDERIARASCLVSEEVLSQSPAEVNAYLKSLKTKALIAPLNRARAIFIGFGAAGKTSVIRVLNGESIIAGKEEMTPGIEIREWARTNLDIRADIWDFGGQVMAHATHQFFLRSSCLYVLVLDGRTEINANQQAEYWLEHVRAFGDSAPTMLVGNKVDQAPINWDMRYLREKYPNIVNFYAISCTNIKEYRAEFGRFERDFGNCLRAIDTHKILLTEAHFAVLNAVRKQSPKKTFLSNEDFERLCRDHGIGENDELNQDWLLGLLDKLGIIIHFPDLNWLDSYLLNPRWLTYGIYTILYDKQMRQKRGRINHKTIIQILRNKSVKDNVGNVLDYRPEHCRFIIDALEQFEIGFRLPGKSRVLLIPALLPSDTPEHNFVKDGALVFDFDFGGFLPRHLMPGFIVRRHAEIVNSIVWQNGVRLRSKGLEATALVQVYYHERRLTLWVRGKQAGRYFSALHSDILEMISRMPDLSYKEWLRLPGGDVEERASFRQLLALEDAGEKNFVCEYGTYNLSELLKTVAPKSLDEQLTKIINIENIERLTMGNKDTRVNISKSNISGSTLNWGQISAEVRNAVSSLPENSSGEVENIKETLASLQRLIEHAEELDDSDKSEALKKVQEVAEAVKNPGEEKSIVKTAVRFFKGLADDVKNAKELTADLLVLSGRIGEFFRI